MEALNILNPINVKPFLEFQRHPAVFVRTATGSA